MKSIKKALNVALGNIEVSAITKQTNTLIDTDKNQAEVFNNWNANLVANDKWYNFTNGKLPIEFIKATKESIAVSYFNQPEMNNVLGYYVEVDGKSKRIDKKELSQYETNAVFNMTLDTVVNNVKPSNKMKAVKELVSGVNRTFAKDKWDKKLNQWKSVAKQYDDNGEVAKKEKAKRNFVEMVEWNVLGNPDKHDELGYSGSLVRKCINDKDDMIDTAKFTELAEKFIADLKKLS